jgi:hypothetical protein
MRVARTHSQGPSRHMHGDSPRESEFHDPGHTNPRDRRCHGEPTRRGSGVDAHRLGRPRRQASEDVEGPLHVPEGDVLPVGPGLAGGVPRRHGRPAIPAIWRSAYRELRDVARLGRSPHLGKPMDFDEACLPLYQRSHPACHQRVAGDQDAASLDSTTEGDRRDSGRLRWRACEGGRLHVLEGTHRTEEAGVARARRSAHVLAEAGGAPRHRGEAAERRAQGARSGAADTDAALRRA